MEDDQQFEEIDMMLGWLQRKNRIDYVMIQSDPARWSVYLVKGYKHIGGAKSTHAYLSGATDMMHIYEYGSEQG